MKPPKKGSGDINCGLGMPEKFVSSMKLQLKYHMLTFLSSSSSFSYSNSDSLTQRPDFFHIATISSDLTEGNVVYQMSWVLVKVEN